MSIRGGRGPRDDLAYPAEPAPSNGKRQSGYQRTGRYGRGPGDQRKYDRYGDRGGGVSGLLKFLLFLAVLAGLVLLALITVGRPIARLAVVALAEDNPSALRIGFVQDLVREDLGASLTAPAGGTSDEIVFTVDSGDTPVTLAPRLKEAGVIDSERAFLFQARTTDLGSRLNAGRFSLAGNLTPAQVVEGLVNNEIVVTSEPVTFREGLRLEQMTALLQLKQTPVDPEEFYRLVTNPPDELLADYPWLLDENVRPKGATLEGFLYPATYDIRTDAEGATSAEDLVRMMLNAWIDAVGEDQLDVPASRGLTFYQVLTLASIVEREAVLDDERPLIAGVYQNRIDRVPSVKHGLLQADPTVIYAVDTARLGKYSPSWVEYRFWTVPEGGIADQPLPEDLAGYNTYKVRGLPPGPIATPSLASLEAALHPNTKSKYTYFVAIPEGKGAHDFSKNLAEHEQKLRKYGY